MDPTRRAAKSIDRVGVKVEVSFEGLPNVWFPATIIEEVDSNLFLVEYECLGINDEAELRKATVDHHHIRPSTPPIRDTNFVLLEKVDAFYDFGWWSGVITRKLADSRYVVYFKHANKEREVSHLELRLHVEHGEISSVKHSTEERATVLLNFTSPIEDTSPGIEKQTSIVAETMKRTKVTSAGSHDKHLRPSKKLNPGIPSDDQTLSDSGKSKRLSNASAGQSGQTLDKTEILSRGKRKLINRDKGVELNSPMTTSARKRGLSKALPRGGTGDSIKTRTPKIVEKGHVTKELHLPAVKCVMGLQCKRATISQAKILMLPEKNPPKMMEVETPKSGAPLAPKTTGNLVQDPKPIPNEGKEAAAGATVKRKRGRPVKVQSKNLKTPVAVNHENGDAGSPKAPQQNRTPLVNVEKVANTSSGKVLSKSVKGKRGKRRKIRSINIVSPAQKPNGGLEKESWIVPVEKSADSISDDQPLSRWIEGIQQHPSGGTAKKPMDVVKSPSFEKRSTLWGTLEAMELFKMIPQNPHFQPLENEKECTREGQAISKMVTYLRVVEATSQLNLDDPKSAIDDNLEALVELEAHGFDVKAVRDRLTELFFLKVKQEGLEEQSKKVKDKMEAARVEGQRIDKEIEAVDKQVVALLEKRAQVLLNKEKKDSEVGALEAEVDGINDDMSEARRKFDGLAAAALCVADHPGVALLF